MMTTYRLKFLILIFTCLLFCSSTYCIKTSETTAAVTKTTNTIKSTPTNERHSNKIVLTKWEKHEKFENKDHENSDDDDDDDDDNDDDKYKSILGKSKSDHNEDDDNDNAKQSSSSKDDKHENKDRDNSKPSNTVVTTIIVVSTEVPTSIYTGNTNPAKQKGTGDQINDPNSDNPKSQRPSETEIVDELIKGRNAYHQLVMALSIVGGIAGIALVTGIFIFVRMRIRKRKRKEDLEMARSSSSSSPSPPSSPTFPSPTHQPHSSLPSLNAGSSSAMSEDGDMTVLNFNSDPFMDPPDTPTNHKTNQMFINRSSVSPSAPPTLPIHLEPNGYINYRQNLTLSMLSQTASTVAPSAPSAKELNAIPKHENPFEEEYGSDHLDQQASITRENIRIREYRTPIPSQSIPPSQRITLTQSTDSLSSDLLPPPAYTPCAPSAPPLYALPTNIRSIEPLQYEEDFSRRHSTSSCSVISSVRPLSLRRGSGSLAHISSPFS